MRKKFKIEITNPCEADLTNMSKIPQGYFCSLCNKDVIDFTKNSSLEISQYILAHKNESICAQVLPYQLEQTYDLVAQSKKNTTLKYAAVAASLLAVSGISAQNQESTTPTTETHFVKGKIAQQPSKNQTIKFVLKGKILDKTTNLPLSDKKYSDLKGYINYGTPIIYNPKTGEYSVEISLEKNQNQLSISLFTKSLEQDVSIELDLSKIKNNILYQDLKIDTNNFTSVKIAGGLGVIYQ